MPGETRALSYVHASASPSPGRAAFSGALSRFAAHR
jgi:hypothetical protein